MAQLSHNQLKALAEYIQSRGSYYKEPRIMMEVLDHFACKVEEIWTAEPTLTFDEAKIKAHKSFGVLGFKPIADAAIASVEQQFANYGKQLEGNFFKSYRLWICILCTIALYIVLYKIGSNWLSRGLVLGLYIVHIIVYIISIPKVLKNSIYLTTPPKSFLRFWSQSSWLTYLSSWVTIGFVMNGNQHFLVQIVFISIFFFCCMMGDYLAKHFFSLAKKDRQLFKNQLTYLSIDE